MSALSAVNMSSLNLAPLASLRDEIRLLSAIGKFLFVLVSRQTKGTSLRPLRLCGEKIVCVNLRKSAVKYHFFVCSPVVSSP